MKYFSKINRGAILTALIIIAVICYLITNSVMQNREKPEIKQICETYLQKEISYNMLPLEYRVDKPAMIETVLNDYLALMKKDIIEFYPQNEQYYKFVIQTLTNDLTNQAKGTRVVFQYEKKIIRYDSILFDKDTVNVQFTSSTTMEAKDINNIGSTAKDKITQETQDNIILQKIGGKWKVIFASISRPMSNNYPGKVGYGTLVNEKY